MLHVHSITTGSHSYLRQDIALQVSDYILLVHTTICFSFESAGTISSRAQRYLIRDCHNIRSYIVARAGGGRVTRPVLGLQAAARLHAVPVVRQRHAEIARTTRVDKHVDGDVAEVEETRRRPARNKRRRARTLRHHS